LHSIPPLEIQAGLAGTGCQLGNATGVKITAAIENDLCNALFKCALCNGFTNDERCFLLVLPSINAFTDASTVEAAAMVFPMESSITEQRCDSGCGKHSGGALRVCR